MLIDVKKAELLGLIPCKVYCDGKELPGTFKFDVEESYAVAYELDVNGAAVVDSKGDIKEVRHEGVITYEKYDL